jgi:hypothetical protein
MAMMNDDLLASPANWPNLQPGDDLSGWNVPGFFAKNSSGQYVNITKQLGLAVPIPSRGIAMADTTGTGRLDFAVARQFAAPVFYANMAKDLGNNLTLNLYRPSTLGTRAPLEGLGAPAYGTTVTIKTPGHTQISQLDGGSGHDGYRSFQVRFGLGSYSGPVSATIQWPDASGGLHEQTVQLSPGPHNLMLTSTVKEVSGS